MAVMVTCPACRGDGLAQQSESTPWPLCGTCAGIGRTWTSGAPSFGRSSSLADRVVGEIVTLGNGDRAKIAWHMPRKTKKVRPRTTFLLPVDPFTGEEDATPIAYPSCVGVASVDVARGPADIDDHSGERDADLNDPVHRTVAGRLI